MRAPVVVFTYLGLFTLAAFPGQAFSQVPTRESEPVLRAPRPTTEAPRAAGKSVV